MPAPEVSVVVPSHGGARTLPPLLEALRGQTLAPERFEVIVVETGADGGWRLVEDAAGEWPQGGLRPLRGPLDGGPAAKRNLGAAAARGRLVAFTDADCLPEPEWLAAGLTAHLDGYEVVQGTTLPPPGAATGPLSHAVWVREDTGLHETCNIFYGQSTFARLGGFTTSYYRRFGLPFGEDAELGWRARRSGAAYRFEPRAVVRHPVGAPRVGGALRERWLARAFPALLRDVPELRDSLMYRRFFLSARSARFAAALAGTLTARRAPAAALLALPYLGMLATEARTAGDPVIGARDSAVRTLGDAVTAAALLYGSLRWRRPLI